MITLSFTQITKVLLQRWMPVDLMDLRKIGYCNGSSLPYKKITYGFHVDIFLQKKIKLINYREQYDMHAARYA